MQPRDLALRRAGLGGSNGQCNRCTVVVLGALILAVGVTMLRRDAERAAAEHTAVALEKLKVELARMEDVAAKAEAVTAATASVNTVKAEISVMEAARAAAAAKASVEAPVEVARVVARDAIVPLAAPRPPISDSIEQQPLPTCSVVFFHHLEKTAGTTLRSILQRNAQRGHFDFFSFINRYNKFQFQMVTHRLDTLATQGGAALDGLRLAVEIHIGGGGYEHFIKYTMPDLLLLRKKLRTAGCKCNLVTLLRHPLTAHMSWHHHFVNQRVPLCFWNSPHDCQARMSIALACHGGPSVRPLTAAHQQAISQMWSSFDLVGVTEYFDEFVVLLADLVGLPSIAYRSQLATKKTTEARRAAQAWTARSCASLVAGAPSPQISILPRPSHALSPPRGRSAISPDLHPSTPFSRLVSISWQIRQPISSATYAGAWTRQQPRRRRT